MNEPVYEGEIVSESTALAVAERGNGAMLAPVVSPQEARAAMDAYVNLCEAVLSDDDYQVFEQWDPKIRAKVKKKFKKKSAVKKLQTFWGVTVTAPEAVRDDIGEGHFGFRVRAIARAKDGRTVEAWGACSTQEERFDVTQRRDESDADFDYRRRKSLARAYHDVLSTAETRATNRAVMNIIGVGGGEVTADEISRKRVQQPSADDTKQPPDPKENPAVWGARFCRKIGVSDDARYKYIKEHYGVDSFTKMKPEQIREVCAFFQKVKREEREQQ